MEQKPLRRSGVAAWKAMNQDSPQNARKNSQRAAPEEREAERPKQIRDCEAAASRTKRKIAGALVNDAADEEGDANDEEEPNGRERIAELHTT